MTAQGTDSGSGWFSWSTLRCSCLQLWLISLLWQIFLPIASGEHKGRVHIRLTNGSWSWWHLILAHLEASLSPCLCLRAQHNCCLGTVTSRSTPGSRKPHESEPQTTAMLVMVLLILARALNPQLPNPCNASPGAKSHSYPVPPRPKHTASKWEPLVNLQKLYAAERHFSNKDRRKQTRIALFTLLLYAYLKIWNKSSSASSCFRVHSRTHKIDFVQTAAQGVSHKVANSLPGPASTPRSERRERGKGNKRTLHTLPSE